MRESSSGDGSIASLRNGIRSAGLRNLTFSGLALLCLLLAIPTRVGAEEAPDKQLTFSMTDTWNLELFPDGHLYDRYVADPLRPGFSMTRVSILDSDLPDAGQSRYNFMLGGRYGLLKLRHSEISDMTLQLDIYGAFLGQFDRDNSFDNVGWDGFFGYMLTWASGDGLSLKLAMQHDSSHVGDEYAERTGRQRIGYTREEIVFGLSYRFPEYVRVYAEAGYGHDLRTSEFQKPWRVKGGVEFEDPDRFLGGRLGYYTAVDLSFMAENDWETDITLHAGVVLPVRRFSQSVRFGPIYRNGRSILGEFFQYREEWWGLGLWIDI